MGLKFVHVDGVDVVDNGGDGDDVDDAGNIILFTGAPSTAPFCFCRSFVLTSSLSTLLLLLLLLPPPVFVLISLLFLLIISNEGMSMSGVSMNGSGIRRTSGFE